MSAMRILRSPERLGEDGRYTSHSGHQPGQQPLLLRSSPTSRVVRRLYARPATGDKILTPDVIGPAPEGEEML